MHCRRPVHQFDGSGSDLFCSGELRGPQVLPWGSLQGSPSRLYFKLHHCGDSGSFDFVARSRAFVSGQVLGAGHQSWSW